MEETPTQVEPAPDGTTPELSRSSIHQYVWLRYVEHEPPPYLLDEEAALAWLDTYYQRNPIEEDAECFYYGILAYEHSFAAPQEQKVSLLKLALRVFRWYRGQSLREKWGAVEDRYRDALELLEPYLPPPSPTPSPSS